MPDLRILVTDPADKTGPKVKGCIVCEKPIPDTDSAGVDTGACSSDCYESPGYDEATEG